MKITKKQLLVGGGVIALIVIAVGLGFLTQQLLKSPPKQQPAQTGSGLPTIVAEVESLRSSGKADEAAKKTDTALAQSDLPSSTKHLLYIEKGLAALDTQNYQAALDAFKLAADVEQNTNVYRLIGEANYQLGKKADAVTAYQKAISLIKVESTWAETTKLDLQQRIDGITQEMKQ
jgi:tetratricopeptide (TPR) repeat protein